jgi:hypothetical protein
MRRICLGCASENGLQTPALSLSLSLALLARRAPHAARRTPLTARRARESCVFSVLSHLSLFHLTPRRPTTGKAQPCRPDRDLILSCLNPTCAAVQNLGVSTSRRSRARRSHTGSLRNKNVFFSHGFCFFFVHPRYLLPLYLCDRHAARRRGLLRRRQAPLAAPPIPATGGRRRRRCRRLALAAPPAPHAAL